MERTELTVQGHIDEILSLDVVAHQEMFIELGEALMTRDLYERALDCFAPINEEESVSPPIVIDQPPRAWYYSTTCAVADASRVD